MSEYRVELPNLRATEALAEAVAAAIQDSHSNQPLTIALSGTLGSGKTQWVRYFCAAFGIDREEVTSPTYVLLQRYRGLRTIYHFDFYRLESEAQVWDLGIDELFEQPLIVLIEWADKFPQCLPEAQLKIQLEQLTADKRSAQLSGVGESATAIVTAVSRGLS